MLLVNHSYVERFFIAS